MKMIKFFILGLILFLLPPILMNCGTKDTTTEAPFDVEKVMEIIPGDVNDDGVVNILDMIELIKEFRKQSRYDINGDGVLDEKDINAWKVLKYEG